MRLRTIVFRGTAVDSIFHAATGCEIIADVGWTGARSSKVRDGIAELAQTHPSARWIAATESCRSRHAIADLAASTSKERVILGLDYRQGELLSHDAGEREWIEIAAEVGCGGAIVLDLARVGTARGPVTMDVCRRVKRIAPSLSVYSGGGNPFGK